MPKLVTRVWMALAALGLLAAAGAPAAPVLAGGTACGGLNCLYLPTIRRGCSAVGGAFAQGLAIQYDLDNPPRPTATWVGKNLRYRAYEEITGQAGFTPSLIDYGPSSADPFNTPPQFRTLFSPARTPASASLRFFRTYNWNDAPSPNPGTRGSAITDPPVTVLGLPASVNETIYAPSWSGFINAGVATMVMYADASSVTLAYHREDSAGDVGYTVYIDGLCTDPNLVALYNAADTSGSRYTFIGRGSEHYNLPYLAPNQAIGTAASTSIMVAVVDSGPLMDPRSCRGWWLESVGTSACPVRDGNTIR